MPIVDGRLTCFSGHDLGFDASDPYADPNCRECLRLEMETEYENYLEEERKEKENDSAKS